MFGVDDVCVYCGHTSRIYFIINGERFCSRCFDDMEAFGKCELCIKRKMTLSRSVVVVGEEEEEEVHEGGQLTA